jgi:hypothetical protein
MQMNTVEYRDITADIGPLHTRTEPAKIPMFSYERPAYLFWQFVFEGLQEKGWTEEQAIHWLQSKGPRWELDGTLGEAIAALGKQWAAKVAVDYADSK